MIIVEVLVERIANALNRSFSYAYDLDDEIKIGERVIVNFNNKDIVAYVVNIFKDDLSYEEKCKELNAHIGIIAVPQQYAQEICDKLINAGIKGIWNFSSSILKVSDDVIVQNVNMASSLAILSNKLKEKLYK